MVTQVCLRTLDSAGLTNFNFQSPNTPIKNQIVTTSEPLKDAFNELDWNNDKITFFFSPDKPHFRIESEGVNGSFQVDFPVKNGDAVLAFQSVQTQEATFQVKSLNPGLKALSCSDVERTLISINSMGMLKLEHKIKMEDLMGSVGELDVFVDFFLVPCADDVEVTTTS